MEPDFQVVCVLIKRTAFLEHDHIRPETWNPVPDVVKKIGDVTVILERRIYFIYIGVPKVDDFNTARRANHLEWCRQAEHALKEYFRKHGDTDLQLISGPDGMSQHELGTLEAT